jgi:hypothetical protein
MIELLNTLLHPVLAFRLWRSRRRSARYIKNRQEICIACKWDPCCLQVPGFDATVDCREYDWKENPYLPRGYAEKLHAWQQEQDA